MNLKEKRIITAKRGNQLETKSWLTEAALRMLCNNLNPEVAEKPYELIVYGGLGKTGVMRHADAGYELATQCAKENNLWLPCIKE